MSYGQTSSTLWGPHPLVAMAADEASSGGGETEQQPNVVEVSVHTLPRQLQREFQHVFDERNLNLESIVQQHTPEKEQLLGGPLEFLVIPTNQRAREDLVAVGENIEHEKDRLLNVFMKFARTCCEQLREHGYWADFIDPCSGLPMLTLNCNKVYSEVDGMECCLGYRAYNAGFCKILTHPAWGSAVYPASMFAYAPRNVVIQLLQSFPKSSD
eukprot:CAMPEP_0198141640 /NCGR_PEP_ID=MMETSP1443-20131203/4616_1 /TAXON_ID=186043 /ORGANISM="Entomoneis sp., Strain CCMP2396" /LENGTH=212 /DNA_ID=CAMNT_0043804447 /DNA_START=41 /DNA_END=679 /DNA_ORIENTATION=+